MGMIVLGSELCGGIAVLVSAIGGQEQASDGTAVGCVEVLKPVPSITYGVLRPSRQLGGDQRPSRPQAVHGDADGVVLVLGPAHAHLLFRHSARATTTYKATAHAAHASLAALPGVGKFGGEGRARLVSAHVVALGLAALGALVPRLGLFLPRAME